MPYRQDRLPSHAFSFEVWPAIMPPDTWPQPVPGHTGIITAADARTARAKARDHLGEGTALGAGSHHRGVCCPPHPGSD